jgi:Predicted dehydrogenases and related proteins
MTSQLPLKVGLIGAGNIAGAHLLAYKQFPEQLQLKAICDVLEENAQARAREMDIQAIYSDPLKMIREADIEAVDICVPPDQHAELAILAAEAGKHVLVEKPMACSLEDCKRMLAAAQENAVTLMVAQDQRYTPSYQGLRRLIQQGELGTIRAVRFDSMQNARFIGAPGHWTFDGKRAGGGIVMSVAIHRFDLLRFLLGEIKRVSALSRTTNPSFINGAEDFACGLLEFESGAIGEMFATYSGFRMPWGQGLMIFGDRGAIHAISPGHTYGPAFIASTSTVPADVEERNLEWEDQYSGFVPVETSQEGLPTTYGRINEILHFAECCRTGEEPLSSGRDNIKTMRIIFGMYESACQNGQAIDLATL